MPTWETGREGLLIASLDPYMDLKNPSNARMRQLNAMNLLFYNRQVHRAAFAIPQFILEALQEQSENPQQRGLELWMSY